VARLTATSVHQRRDISAPPLSRRLGCVLYVNPVRVSCPTYMYVV
jgi:hypothetical protein